MIYLEAEDASLLAQLAKAKDSKNRRKLEKRILKLLSGESLKIGKAMVDPESTTDRDVLEAAEAIDNWWAGCKKLMKETQTVKNEYNSRR